MIKRSERASAGLINKALLLLLLLFLLLSVVLRFEHEANSNHERTEDRSKSAFVCRHCTRTYVPTRICLLSPSFSFSLDNRALARPLHGCCCCTYALQLKPCWFLHISVHAGLLFSSLIYLSIYLLPEVYLPVRRFFFGLARHISPWPAVEPAEFIPHIIHTWSFFFFYFYMPLA